MLSLCTAFTESNDIETPGYFACEGTNSTEFV